MFVNICSDSLEASKNFYTELLGLTIKYDSDWYIQLSSPDNPELECGLIQTNHELVPREYQHKPNGMYITFVVNDVDAIYEKALAMAAEIIQPPKNEFYGQRRLLLKDPNHCLLDICSPTDNES